jgi:hypothetical protein
MSAELHGWLALASGFLATLVGIEALLRAIRRTPPGPAASRLEGVLLVAIGVTAAGGLGILAAGGSPRELLHVVYAVVALGILPVAGRLGARWEARRRGFTTLIGAVVTLVAFVRLYATG